jgi:hypothetical protein
MSYIENAEELKKFIADPIEYTKNYYKLSYVYVTPSRHFGMH